MSPESIEIVYAAHTSTCTFLLDGEGICRRVVLAPNSDGKRRENPRTASRCVGAQYVASLDMRAIGGLVERPRVGASMLFARTDSRGRVSLVRTGHVTSFETMRAEDPFDSMGSIRTSAPALQQLFTPKSTPAVADVAAETVPEELDYEAEARTLPVQIIRPDELPPAGTADTGETVDVELNFDGDETFEQPRRATIPSPGVPTLWGQPGAYEEDDNPYAHGPRTNPSPKTDPYLIRGVGRTPVPERTAPRVIGASRPSLEPRPRETREAASSRRRGR
ncbi:hypothetical protein AKJ09_00720 [Labilithrix luteola]|uniref:Uncharacterized protein n=1 Tax=Labilithrix luteola TaxID=1391654 RepID=A0A0K1PKX7_9BACT|nr:hypothetical protein [Labilithrix luteola]AKU94056.1 hypothetical protein AKJ09_00720 [Labilithrix luteola]